MVAPIPSVRKPPQSPAGAREEGARCGGDMASRSEEVAGGRFGSLFFPHATEKIKLCNYDGTVPELNGSNDLPGPFVLFWDKERGEMRKNNY